MASTTPPPRGGRTRDRRGRARHGPLAIPGPITPHGVPIPRSPRDQFDAIVLAAIDRLRPRFGTDLEELEFGVEETPLLSPNWSGEDVPLASTLQPTGSPATRIVLFRLPISARAEVADLADVVLAVIIEQLAGLWHRDVDDIDPRL